MKLDQNANSTVQKRLLYWTYDGSSPEGIPDGVSEREWVAFGTRIIGAMHITNSTAYMDLVRKR